MFCVGLILYEMLLPPMPTALERYNVFLEARVLFIFAFVSFRLDVCDLKSRIYTEKSFCIVSKCFFLWSFQSRKTRTTDLLPKN